MGNSSSPEIPTSPVVAMVSPSIGNPAAGNRYEYSCPSGHYVKKVSGNADGIIRGYQVECSNGAKSPWFGGKSGTPFTDINNDGYAGWELARYGELPDGIQFKYPNGNTGQYIGGSGGALIPSFTCSSGKVTRVFGTSDDNQLYSMHLECDDLISQPYTTSTPSTYVPPPTPQVTTTYVTPIPHTSTVPDPVPASTSAPAPTAPPSDQTVPKKSPIWLYTIIFIVILIVIIIIAIVIVVAVSKKKPTA